MLNISEPAIKQIDKLSKGKEADGLMLRIFVEPGGCSGFEYGMSFDVEKPGDIKIVEDSISVLVDKDSASYLKGCSVHFDDGLTGKGFEIKNPNASSTCGCGRSFN